MLAGTVQLYSNGVMVIVAVIGVLPALIAVNEGALPLPLAASTIAGLELVQLKLAPAGVLLKVVAATVELLHAVIFAIAFTVGNGSTVTVAMAVPEQLPVVPVTV